MQNKMKNKWRSISCFCILLLMIAAFSSFINDKQTVTNYMDGFNAGDHPKILSCLTDDVIWEMPGVYHHSGKAAFDKEIENEGFVGRPTIKITRLVEESDVVIAEGTVQSKKKDGGQLNAVFCDVFVMEKGKIKKLTSYFMAKTP